MAFLITPIDIGSGPECCNPDLRRTEADLAGDAVVVPGNVNKWTIFHSGTPPQYMPGTDPPEENVLAKTYGEDGFPRVFEGSVKFGVCCAAKVVIVLSGWTETYVAGDGPYDWVEVWQNGVLIAQHEAIRDTQEPWARRQVGPHTVEVDLAERPCGHVFEIAGSTEDEFANNNVYWQAEVTIIPGDFVANTLSFDSEDNSQYLPLI